MTSACSRPSIRPTACSARLHRGAAPQDPALPEHVIPLGRTVGFPANGASRTSASSRARSRRCAASSRPAASTSCTCTSRSRRSLGWDALVLRRRRRSSAPSTPTPRTRVTNGAARALGAGAGCNRLHGRIAVSEAAAWTARRFFGGRYAIIPNGVAVPDEPRAEPRGRARARCGSRSSARPSSARACRCCCAPSRRCASTSPPS